MANKSVVLYQYVRLRNKWKYIRAVEPLKRLSKGYYCLSWYEGAVKQWENVGVDPQKALEALNKKQLEMAFVASGGEVKERSGEPKTPAPVTVQVSPARTKLSDAIAKYLERCRARQGKSGYGMAGTSVGAYEYRLGFLLEFRPQPDKERITGDEKNRDIYLDEIDKDFLYAFLTFLRKRTISETAAATTSSRR